MSEISAISSAIAGMALAQRRFDSAAAVVASAGLPTPSGPAGAQAADGDVAGAPIDQLMAVRMFGLNAAVARSADALMAETIHIADGLVAE